MIDELTVLNEESSTVGRFEHMSKFSSMTSIDDRSKIINASYQVPVYIGQGHTRSVWQMTFMKHRLNKPVLLKIPFEDIDLSSLTTYINYVKGNLNDNEVEYLSELRHPNIVQLLDIVPLSDGRLATVEEHFEARSLDKIVQDSKLNDSTFRDYFSGLIAGVSYLHSKGILHRDIKPSNVFVNEEYGEVKLGDLQNARKLSELVEDVLTSHGKTCYTHPDILNATFGNVAKSSFKTDIYALGATMYYALTGKEAFDYQLVEDKDGWDLHIGDRIVKAGIKTGGRIVQNVTQEMHNSNLEDALKAVPDTYKELIRNCLKFNGGYDDTGALQRDMDALHKGIDAKKTRSKYVAPIVYGALASLLIGAATGKHWIHKLGWERSSIIGVDNIASFVTPSHPNDDKPRQFADEKEQSKDPHLFQPSDELPNYLNPEYLAEQYTQLFEHSFDHAKSLLIGGKIKTKIDLDSDYVRKMAEKYGFEPYVIKGVFRANKCLAGEQTVDDYKYRYTDELQIFDPLYYRAGFGYEHLCELRDNFEQGIARLAKCRDNNGGNVEKGLIDFYSELWAEKVPTGMGTTSGVGLGERSINWNSASREAIDKMSKKMAYNAIRGGFQTQDMARFTHLREPPKDFYKNL